VRDERPGFARYAEAAAKGLGLGDVAGVAKIAGPAAVAAVAYQVKETGLAAAKLYQNETLPENVRRRSLLRTLPGGDTLLDVGDTISGRARGMQRIEEQRAIRLAQMEQQVQIERSNMGARAEVAPSVGRSYALMGRSAVVSPYVDRSTPGGEEEFQRQQRMLPIRQGIEAAGIAHEASSYERMQAEEEGIRIARRKAELDEKIKRAEAIEGKFDAETARPKSLWQMLRPGPLSALGVLGAGADFAGVGQDILDKYRNGRPDPTKRVDNLSDLDVLRTQMTATKEDERNNAIARRDKLSRESEAARQLAIERARMARLEADLAREKANTAASASSKIGGNREATLQAMEARRYINRVGIENSPSDVIEQARTLYPKEIETLTREAGQKSPLYAQAAALGQGVDVPNEPLGDLNEKARGAFAKLDKEAGSKEGQAIRQEFEAVEKSAREQVEAMKSFLRTVEKSQEEILKALEETEKRMKDNARRQALSQG
jgi:hypothetical protein